MKYRAILAGLTVALFFTTGCIGGRGGSQALDEEIITPVAVQQIEYSDISSMIVYAGQITANETVNVSSKISGRVKDVFFDIGDVVNEGDVLFTLDEVDLLNQIRQLEGQLNVAAQGVRNAENTLSSVTGGQFSSQILQMETAVSSSERQVESARLGLQNSEIALNSARDALDNATTSYNNMRVLYEAGSISKNEFDHAELSYRQTQAGFEQASVGYNSAALGLEQAELGLQQASESLALTVGEVTSDNLERARVGVGQAQASREAVGIQLDIARDALNDTAIKAPIGGVISTRSVRASEFTSTQMPAFSIVDIDTVAVSVRVSELIINLLQPGQEVELYVNTISSEPITGIITTISPAADMTSTYPVKIEIPNPGQLMKPGMFAEAHFVRAASSSTVVLPHNAVLEDTQGRFVYLAVDGIAIKTPVETGIDNGKEIEILSGVAQGAAVIIRGQDFVNDGEKITVVS